jgi:hypothetical protein
MCGVKRISTRVGLIQARLLKSPRWTVLRAMPLHKMGLLCAVSLWGIDRSVCQWLDWHGTWKVVQPVVDEIPYPRKAPAATSKLRGWN